MGVTGVISAIDIARDTITVRPEAAFKRSFLREDFVVTYQHNGAPLAMTEELALIPFLANVAPIVWLAGLDVTVPTLDRAFAKALDDVRDVFATMYPDLEWGGSIKAGRLLSTDRQEPAVAVLFSGGVDSVYSSLSIADPQLLVTVRGSDIALDNDPGWEAVRRQAIDFGQARGRRNAFVVSNFRRFLNVPALEHRWPTLGDWWAGIQHGLGLLGLLAPLVPAGRVVIAATHTPAYDGRPSGSNPTLDTSVRWGGTTVEHHGFDASRQEKVRAIVAADGPPSKLRVCFSNAYGDGDNCEVCEKCLRTFVALVVAGADPRDHGFTRSTAARARTIRRRFATYRVAFGPNHTWHWSMIKEAAEKAPAGPAGSDADAGRRDLLAWLSTFDFARYERRWQFFLRARKRLLRGLRRIPRVETALRRAVTGLHRLQRRLTPSAARN
jgi:hypothetical protein